MHTVTPCMAMLPSPTYVCDRRPVSCIRYDWVMCLDLDTVVMDHSVPLLDFLDPHADAVFSMDFWAINSGRYLLTVW